MQTTLKTQIRNLLEDTPMWSALQRMRDNRKIQLWERDGRPVPPPHAIKRRILSSFARPAGPETLVETGTYLGDMIFAMKDQFSTIYSIELSEELANMARRRFRSHQSIQILTGDSGEILPQILTTLSTPCLFWLDGHYSGGITAKGHADTPIIKELTAILEHSIKVHIILIDDARCFDGSDGYPTLLELQELVSTNGPEYSCAVADDVIRILPRDASSRVSR